VELVLVRHGQPHRVDHDPNGADPGLTELGHRQAKAMASFLERERFDSVYVSPQRRARETALPLVDLHGAPPTVVEGVAEYDYGHSSYVPGEQWGPVTAADLQRLMADLTSPDFRDRVISSIDRIVADHPGDHVAVVCHGGVISTVLTHILDVDPSHYFNTDYTSVTRIRASRAGRRSLVTFNESHWLAEL
jgi:probable phosphoglycerate mutase